jgi:hypothetical protein
MNGLTVHFSNEGPCSHCKQYSYLLNNELARLDQMVGVLWEVSVDYLEGVEVHLVEQEVVMVMVMDLAEQVEALEMQQESLASEFYVLEAIQANLQLVQLMHKEYGDNSEQVVEEEQG